MLNTLKLSYFSLSCYLIQLSHMIADGATYYMLLKQFQALLNDKEIG